MSSTFENAILSMYVCVRVHAPITFSLNQSSVMKLSVHSTHSYPGVDWIKTHLQLTALIQLHCELLPTGSLFSAH